MSDSPFTEEDKRLFEEMYRIKRGVLEKVHPDKVYKTQDLELALRTAESIENTVMKVKKMEQVKEENNTDLVTMATEVIKALRVSEMASDVPTDREPPKLEHGDVETVPGELEIGKNILNHEEVLKEPEEDD